MHLQRNSSKTEISSWPEDARAGSSLSAHTKVCRLHLLFLQANSQRKNQIYTFEWPVQSSALTGIRKILAWRRAKVQIHICNLPALSHIRIIVPKGYRIIDRMVHYLQQLKAVRVELRHHQCDETDTKIVKSQSLAPQRIMKKTGQIGKHVSDAAVLYPAQSATTPMRLGTGHLKPGRDTPPELWWNICPRPRQRGSNGFSGLNNSSHIHGWKQGWWRLMFHLPLPSPQGLCVPSSSNPTTSNSDWFQLENEKVP